MKIIIMFFLLVHSSLVFSLENLQKGVGITEENGSALRSTSIPYAIARQGQRAADNNELVEAYLEVTDSVYSLSSKPDLIQTKKADRTLLGNWPLTRWSHQFVFPEENQRYTDHHWDYPSNEYSQGQVRPLGCFENTPLRYGDIDNDAQNEIVLFLGNDLIIFSPVVQKIIFAETLHMNDWMSLEETAQHISYKTPGVPVTVQYLSMILGDTPDFEAGYRGYSKLYFGDFNNNGKPDIVVWRKLYESRQVADPIKGFSKLNDTWQHFERSNDAANTGEYLPQTTDVETIKGWLSAGLLTWKKGYPSLSECPGQETQLIPEMHDPLLNDPEVLQ